MNWPRWLKRIRWPGPEAEPEALRDADATALARARADADRGQAVASEQLRKAEERAASVDQRARRAARLARENHLSPLIRDALGSGPTEGRAR